MEADTEHEGTKMRVWWWYLPSFQVRWHYLNIFRLSLNLGLWQSYSERTNTDHFIKSNIYINLGFPGGSEGKESACDAGVLGSIPGLKIPWRRAWQPSPIFLPGEYPWTEKPGGLQSMGPQRVRHAWMIKHSSIIDTKVLYTDILHSLAVFISVL